MKEKSPAEWMSVMADLGTFLGNVVGPRVLEIRSSKRLDITEKLGFQDIKTLGDTTSERLVTEWIQEHCPGAAIRGEEGTDVKSDTCEIECIIDPVDGTTNYAAGLPDFGISVGLARNGIPFAGVIHRPAFSKTAQAVTGCGAFQNGKRLTIPPLSRNRAELVIAAGLIKGTLHLFPVLEEWCAGVRMGRCVVQDTMLVAEGGAKAYIHTGATPFDIAAAIAIVREAGGVAVGIDSDELNLSNPKIPIIFAHAPWFVDEIREVVRPHLEKY